MSLVEKKILKGEVHSEDHSKEVILTGSSQELAKSLKTQDLATLFDWSEPGLVLVRISSDPS